MRTIKATDLARQLGISVRSMCYICKNDPTLAFKRNRTYFIRLSELAKRPGFDLVDALLVPHGVWIKAIALAKMAGISRRTMSSWCKTRPHFAKRISNIWYVDLKQLGATDEQIEMIKSGKIKPDLSSLGNPSPRKS